MKLRSVFTGLILLLMFATLAQADTLKMKNGTVIKGKVIRFNNKEFTILIESTSSRAIISVDDIESIEFDSSPGPVTSQSSTSTSRTTVPPPTTQSSNRTTTQTSDDDDSDGVHSGKTTVPNIRSVTVSIPAREDWTSSGIIVAKGQRVRITATGTVDLGNGRRSGPEGIVLDDKDKLMPNSPTGALIAVIGDDNDNFIFVGKQADFVAQRSGRLFLSVNEGNLKDNVGSFSARVEIELSSSTGRQ
ncbi:MAG TPA: hypothetical protein VFC63_27440 [Blastocatellia bacterium]|nr:hypothetical protein [Blastocatellia bacterium]